MQPDELDRALSEEKVIEPSAGFSEAVMAKIEREAETRSAIGFPVRPVLAAMGSAALAAAAAVSAGLQNPTTVAAAHWDGVVAWVGRSAAEIGAAVAGPTATSLALAAIVMLIPLAIYEYVMRSPRGEVHKFERR